MKTTKERIDAIDIDLRHGGGPADPFITITRINARMLVDKAKEAERLQNKIGPLEVEVKLLRKALESIQYEVFNDGSMTDIVWIVKEALSIGEESNAL